LRLHRVDPSSTLGSIVVSRLVLERDDLSTADLGGATLGPSMCGLSDRHRGGQTKNSKITTNCDTWDSKPKRPEGVLGVTI
jgi:hypothetical protein